MLLIISILTAFIVTFIFLPVVIKVSKSVGVLDLPDMRKIHIAGTPSLGGVAIFTGFMLAVLIAIPFAGLSELRYFISALTIIFIMGIRDDIAMLQAKQKLFIQMFAAFILVYFTDVRLTGFYGMMGITEMPLWFTIPLTMFVIVALTNSFNLIDGIDGLAGTFGLLVLTFLGWVFLTLNQTAYAVVCLTGAGALIAFLFYNWYPSKVFMGDTGSMVIGFIISALAIKFINIAPGSDHFLFSINSSVGMAIALLILPIIDTLRVFTIRFFQGKSPLDPDRNHMHHGLLTLGLNHAQATLTLISVNFFILIVAMLLDGFLANGELTVAVIGTTLLFVGALEIKLYQHRQLSKTIVKVSNEKMLYMPKSA